MPEGDMLASLDRLREICAGRDAGQLVVALKEMAPDYSPSAHLLKRVIKPRHPVSIVSGPNLGKEVETV